MEAVEAVARLVLSCPFRGETIVESYEIARLLDAQSPRAVASLVPPHKAVVCLEGLLVQLQLMRGFFGAFVGADVDEAAGTACRRVRELVRRFEEGSESSSSSESSVEDGWPVRSTRSAEELIASLRSRRSVRPALKALATSVASSQGEAFVERFAALGGLDALLPTLAATLADQAAQEAGLAILGHSKLLDPNLARISAPRALEAVVAALRRHRVAPKLVGLAAIALANLAHRDARAAAGLVDANACELLVDAVVDLDGPHALLEAAHAAACWALGTIASMSGLHSDDHRLVHLVFVVRDARAQALFDQTATRFAEDTAAARNAAFAQAQYDAALHKLPGVEDPKNKTAAGDLEDPAFFPSSSSRPPGSIRPCSLQ